MINLFKIIKLTVMINLFKIFRSPHFLPIFYLLFTGRHVVDLKSSVRGRVRSQHEYIRCLSGCIPKRICLSCLLDVVEESLISQFIILSRENCGNLILIRLGIFGNFILTDHMLARQLWIFTQRLISYLVIVIFHFLSVS
jgi:hypothetical protein